MNCEGRCQQTRVKQFSLSSVTRGHFFVFKVVVHPGSRLARALPFGPTPAMSLRKEYSALECTMEVVDDVNDAINHINKYGSAHTDTIVTEDGMLLLCKSNVICQAYKSYTVFSN
jgi:hypothetical protein